MIEDVRARVADVAADLDRLASQLEPRFSTARMNWITHSPNRASSSVGLASRASSEAVSPWANFPSCRNFSG